MIFNQTAAICILRVLLNSWIIITHLRRLLSVGFVIVPKFRGLVICLFNEHLCVHCAYKPKRNWLQIGFTSIILSVLIDWRQILSQKKTEKKRANIGSYHTYFETLFRYAIVLWKWNSHRNYQDIQPFAVHIIKAIRFSHLFVCVCVFFFIVNIKHRKDNAIRETGVHTKEEQQPNKTNQNRQRRIG